MHALLCCPALNKGKMRLSISLLWENPDRAWTWGAHVLDVGSTCPGRGEHMSSLQLNLYEPTGPAAWQSACALVHLGECMLCSI